MTPQDIHDAINAACAFLDPEMIANDFLYGRWLRIKPRLMDMQTAEEAAKIVHERREAIKHEKKSPSSRKAPEPAAKSNETE